MKRGVIFLMVASVVAYLIANYANHGYINGIHFDNIRDRDYVEEVLLENIKSVFADEALDEMFVTYELDFTEYDKLTLFDLLSGEPINVPVDAQVDVDKIREYNEKAEKPVSAYIYKSEGIFKVAESIMGTQISLSKLNEKLASGENNIEVDDILYEPSVTEADLEDTVFKLNTYAKWYVEYLDGSKIEASADFVGYENGEILLNKDWIYELIKPYTSSFQTIGGDWDFTTTDGELITVSGGTWGSSVDIDAEFEYLAESFENGISIAERIPVYEKERSDIGNTYVEVSIENQHLWYYKDGILVFDTPVVTGTYGKHDTPTGVYFISECINGKYLTGDTYKTWVNKWMRLTNSGIGLHDAYWRGTFGGQIYKSNGSHGCVNIPKDIAYSLYTESYVGMPVIIY